jgi:hypothetical protein
MIPKVHVHAASDHTQLAPGYTDFSLLARARRIRGRGEVEAVPSGALA